MKECSDFYNEHRSILKKININPEKVRRYQQAILYYSAKKVRSDGGFPTDTNTLNADFANNETITKHKISDAAIWF